MQNTHFKADDSYYGHLQTSVLQLIECTPRRVLEIGCGRGQALEFLKRERAAEFVAGVELAPEVAELARQNPKLDMIITGDVEQLNLDFPAQYFDVIIASHVLEHLKDPWSFTRRLVKLLHPSGQLIGALPNVRFVKVSLPLVFLGKWEYTEEGILDWTHTRFFTRNSIVEMLASSGLTVDRVVPQFSPKPAVLNRLTFNSFQNLLCYAYNFSARPLGSKEVAPNVHRVNQSSDVVTAASISHG